MIRFVLASTLLPLYGIYSGFELCEGTPLAPGKEEYLNSEKYEIRAWDWDRPGNIRPLITRVNQLRRENPALQEYDNLKFHLCDHDDVIFYEKSTADGRNVLFIAVNLDPFEAHDVTLMFPMTTIGVAEHETWEAEELLTGARHLWRGSHQHVRLEPGAPARIWSIRRWDASEQDFDTFMPATVVDG